MLDAIEIGLMCTEVCQIGTSILEGRAIGGSDASVLRDARGKVNEAARVHFLLAGSPVARKIGDGAFKFHRTLLQLTPPAWKENNPLDFIALLSSTLCAMEQQACGEEVHIEKSRIQVVIDFFNAWNKECRRQIVGARVPAGDDE